jgi:hypothetical protein
MLRISASIAVLTLIGTAVIGVSAAEAQSTPKPKACSFNLEQCVATCKKNGTWKNCDWGCERTRQSRGC